MIISCSNQIELVEKTIDQVNSTIAIASEKGFSIEQVEALNGGNIVTLLGVIATSLATIADLMIAEADEKKKKEKNNARIS